MRSAQRWPRRAELIHWTAFAILYVVAAKIGFQAAFVAEQVSPVWPPTGLALWAMLYLGIRAWPAVWIGALVANATTHVPLVAACAIATGNTLEAILAVWLLRRFTDIDHLLERLRHLVGLILAAAVVSTIVSATIGVTTLCVAGLQPWSQFGLLWWIWWLGDATGDLLVAPVLLTVPLLWRGKEYAARLGEAVVLEASTIALSVFVFIGRVTPLTERHPLEFTLFPLIIWAGMRFAHPGAAIVSASVSFIAVWGTLHGTGPFNVASVPSPQDSVVLLQIFTAVVATSGLVLGGAVAERNRSERLRQADHTLTAILAESNHLKDAAHRILQAVCDTLDWDVGLLWRANSEQQVLEYVDSWQRTPQTDAFVTHSRLRRFTPGLGLPGRVWSSAQPAWIYDVVNDDNFPRAPVAARVGLHGGFAFPILVGPQVLAVMEFFVREPRKADASMLTLMAAAGSQIGQFIDRGRTRQRVVESEALNSAIVDAALDCVITIDAGGRIIEFNPAATLTFGIGRDQALGRELAEVIVPARLRERHREALRRCVETGEARILGKRIEMPACRADGTEFPTELSVTRVHLGERPAFTAHVRDITDRKRMEEERAELLARERNTRIQAEQANRSKDQFLATVSHELRTPLTAILGWASMLQTRDFDPEKLQHVYKSLLRNAQAQAQIVDDLLDVSRIITGQLRLELHLIDVCEVASLSLETVRPTAIAKGVLLNSHLPSSDCLVSGDAARLQQVIWNLLSNAIKFTPAGGTVALTIQTAESAVVIEVSDTGTGIPAAALPHVFERFWQADSTTTRVHGGLGLGLSLVRHIVELHGGGVHASSAGEGRGSTFTVTLPARVRDAVSGESFPSVIKAARGTAKIDPGAVTVLVVDDDLGARELFTAILETRGFRVLAAASAAEALGLFEQQQPDVMIVDIGMPGEDGFMFLREVRAREAARGLRDTPAIAVTAYAGPGAREQVLEAGFSAYIAKPALPHDMVSAILEAIDQPQ